MKILDTAAKLEKAVLDRFARRGDIARHPLELYKAILDDIEEATEPGARGKRIFPYTVITVTIPTTDAHHRATAEAVFDEPPSLQERVRERLRRAGCAGVDDVRVAVMFTAAAPEWNGREYVIDYRRQSVPRHRKTSATPRPAPLELHVTVLAGSTAKARYHFASGRINVGRLADVLDHHNRIVRQNQIAFVDSDEVSQSVSRAHAHIAFDAAAGEARLYDDGSTHGTRVVRAGRTIHVPRGARGIRLHDHDEVLLGQAKLRIELRPVRKR